MISVSYQVIQKHWIRPSPSITIQSFIYVSLSCIVFYVSRGSQACSFPFRGNTSTRTKPLLPSSWTYSWLDKFEHFNSVTHGILVDASPLSSSPGPMLPPSCLGPQYRVLVRRREGTMQEPEHRPLLPDVSTCCRDDVILRNNDHPTQGPSGHSIYLPRRLVLLPLKTTILLPPSSSSQHKPLTLPISAPPPDHYHYWCPHSSRLASLRQSIPPLGLYFTCHKNWNASAVH